MAHQAIERLYEVFGGYPFRHGMATCPCCHGPEDELELRSYPLREIPVSPMFHYTMSAMSTAGDVQDFKHFLPRVMEIAFEADDASIDMEIAFGRLNLGEWRSWPEHEQVAIEQFLEALWDEALASTGGDGGPQTDSVLASLALLRFQLDPFLRRWLTADTEAARLELAQFVVFAVEYPEFTLANPWWPEDRFGEEAVLAWLRLPEVHSYLRQEGEDQLVANALQLLRAAS